MFEPKYWVKLNPEKDLSKNAVKSGISYEYKYPVLETDLLLSKIIIVLPDGRLRNEEMSPFVVVDVPSDSFLLEPLTEEVKKPIKKTGEKS